jgi:hypothetical protein
LSKSVRPEQLSTLREVAHAVFFLPPAAAERVSESEHDDFHDGDAFDDLAFVDLLAGSGIERPERDPGRGRD